MLSGCLEAHPIQTLRNHAGTNGSFEHIRRDETESEGHQEVHRGYSVLRLDKYEKHFEEEKSRSILWKYLNERMHGLNLTPAEMSLIKNDFANQEAQFFRNKRTKITIKDFEPITIIGRGAYGEVRLCRWNLTGEYVAIKKLKKKDMIKKNEVDHILAEKDVLSKSNNDWIIELKCSFQDENFLYLVMEFLPGGDLMNMLIKKDIFSIEEARFYIAETIMAVDYVHNLGYVHRDIKPDNILLDGNGHIKLTDFGLCTSMVG